MANTIPNFKNYDNWIPYKTVNGKKNYTKSGRVWMNMVQRCKPGSITQIRQPRYAGCTLSNDFRHFNYFAEWHQEQVGFNFDSYEIDKDILIPGNKHYSEDTCVLVPGALNNFFVNNEARRGIYPQGVSIRHDTGRFQAVMNRKYLGIFPTPELAYVAYKIAKEAALKEWIIKLESGEYPVDQKVIIALKNWTLENPIG